MCVCANYTKRSCAHIIAYCCKFMVCFVVLCCVVGRFVLCISVYGCSAMSACLVCYPVAYRVLTCGCGGGICNELGIRSPHLECAAFRLSTATIAIVVVVHIFRSVSRTNERSLAHSLAHARARTQFNVVVALFSHTYIYIIQIHMCVLSFSASFYIYSSVLSVTHGIKYTISAYLCPLLSLKLSVCIFSLNYVIFQIRH